MLITINHKALILRFQWRCLARDRMGNQEQNPGLTTPSFSPFYKIAPSGRRAARLGELLTAHEV